MKILGIDPGLASVGYGLIEQGSRDRRPRHITHGVIETSAGLPLALRLDAIHRRLRELISEHEPTHAAVEEIFFSRNVKTAVAVAQARGVAIQATVGLELAEFSPPRIKLALVGHGRADKSQVQQMVRAVLNLPEVPRPDHAADALAAALCHLHSMTTLAGISRAADSAVERPGPNKELLARARTRRGRRR